MASIKFRSVASKNKYSAHLLSGDEMYFIPLIIIYMVCGMPQGGICFSGVEKFLDIFSPVLIFSLVLSFVSSQKKVHLFYPVHGHRLESRRLMMVVHFLLPARKDSESYKYMYGYEETPISLHDNN